MGNQASQALAEDVNVLLVHFPPFSTVCSAISSNKLFKTAKCTDQQSVLFVKIFSIVGLQKEQYKSRLDSINSEINKIHHSHIISSQYTETEPLGVLYRPFIHASLRQKIIRPPFLNLEEKK